MSCTSSNVIEFFTRNSHNIFSFEDIQNALGVSDSDTSNLLQTLNLLEEEGFLYCDKGSYAMLSMYKFYSFGTIKVNRDGSGLVRTSEGVVSISKTDINGALNGDTVIIEKQFIERSEYNKATVKKIVKRKTKEVVFKFHNGRLTPCNNSKINIRLNSKFSREISEGDYVLVTIGKEVINGTTNVLSVKKIGNDIDIDSNLTIIGARNGFESSHNEEVLEEIKLIPDTVSDEECVDRVDLTDEETITMDCDTTQDMDDAFNLSLDKDGNFVLKTHIAHVSHYVKVGYAIFKEAEKRGTSVYMDGKTIHMLPVKLSQGICALKENERRLTRTFETKFSPAGEILDFKSYLSVIKSKKQMFNPDVNKILEDGEMVPGYEKFHDQLCLFRDWNTIMERQRKEKGYLNFASNEIRSKSNGLGKPIKFNHRKLGTAESIVENSMLVPNTMIAREISALGLPFIFRNLDSPDDVKIQMVINVIANLGYQINNVKDFENPKAVQSIIEQISKTDKFPILSQVLLRGMKRAGWCTENNGHYGVAEEEYAQCTAPIRRFTDLVVHILLDYYYSLDFYNEDLAITEKHLEEIAYHSSVQERAADIAEQEALTFKMAMEMTNHIEEEFVGIITDINDLELKVITVNNIIGTVAYEDIRDGEYLFDEETLSLSSKTDDKKYQLGDKVKIKVLYADPEQLKIDFALIRKIDEKKLSHE